MIKKDKFLLVLKKIKEALDKNYPLKKKYEEIKLLGFKIHPLFKEVELLRKKEAELVCVLWQIAKIEEIIEKNYGDITFEELQLILDFVERISSNKKLKTIKEKSLMDKNPKDKTVFEMEIFQEKNSNKKIIN